MSASSTRLAAFLIVTALSAPAGATSLQVAPVTIDVRGGSADLVTLSNLGSAPINAQIRVFKWAQRDGRDVLEPTRDVIASPPIAAVAAGGSQVVRIVRIDKSNLVAEASYRLIVEQIPRREAEQTSTVRFLMRYSVPVFFGPAATSPAHLGWRIDRTSGGLRLTATNAGARRLRVSELKLVRPSGETVVHRAGLVGYVLGGSSASWSLSAPSIATGTTLTIEAMGDVAPIEAHAIVH